MARVAIGHRPQLRLVISHTKNVSLEIGRTQTQSWPAKKSELLQISDLGYMEGKK